MLSYHYNNCGKKKTQNAVEFSRMSTESARRILFKDFGGKKAMKALERKEKMKINVDVVKDQLDKTLLGNNQNGNEIHKNFVLTQNCYCLLLQQISIKASLSGMTYLINRRNNKINC